MSGIESIYYMPTITSLTAVRQWAKKPNPDQALFDKIRINGNKIGVRV